MTLTWDEAVRGKVNEERTATLTFKDNDVRDRADELHIY